MAEPLTIVHSGAAPTTAPIPKIAVVASATKTLMQIHVPWDGPPLRVVEWGVGFDGSAVGESLEAELIETGNVPATGGTNYLAPYTTVNTAISSSGTTTLVVNSHAGFPSSGNYLISVLNEIMQVTAGQGTNSWTVVRGVNNNALSAIPVGTPVLPAGGVPTGDFMPYNRGGNSSSPSVLARQLAYDILNSGSQTASQFAPSSEGSITESRLGDFQQIQPTNNWAHPYPLAREFEGRPGAYLRVRVTNPLAVTVDANAYIIVAE